MCRIIEMKRMLVLAFIFMIISCCRLVNSDNINGNCWTNDAECVVQATLHKSGANTAQDEATAWETLPLEIDCMTMNESDSTVAQPPEYLVKRFERAYRVTLNGCRKAFKWPTYGFEYLPNCNKITELVVTRFHTDAAYELFCPNAVFMQLEILHFEHNEIATLTTEALAKLALLKELQFESNALRHIERGAFDSLHFIERINLLAENLLAIKDATLFEHTNVNSLRLFQLKYITATLFDKLPQTLRELHVEKTTIGVGGFASAAEKITATADTVSVNNFQKLGNISLIDCALRHFRLNDIHGSLQHLNLSANFLQEFHLTKNGTTQGSLEVRIVDLSYNRLGHMPLDWLSMLGKLEHLHLNGNLLKTLPLMPILEALPKIQTIDLRHNQLESLTEPNPSTMDIEAFYRVMIFIDKNAWNCKWLLGFAHSHPELFRIFHYEKFLSQINVNGLECVPEEPKPEKPLNISAGLNLKNANTSSFMLVASNDTQQDRLNVSTFTLIYGSPYDIKRNQRAEALIIVFMLPVGIAALFLLLYLWIYCQKVFHLSFYRNCRLCKRRRKSSLLRINHFDVVRQFPPTLMNTNTITTTTTTTTVYNNEDYEMPINGVAPTCNCAQNNSNSTLNMATDLTSPEKCLKTHHITYVPLPDEQPEKMYEEIIGGDDEEDEMNNSTDRESNRNESHSNTLYDDLPTQS